MENRWPEVKLVVHSIVAVVAAIVLYLAQDLRWVGALPDWAQGPVAVAAGLIVAYRTRERNPSASATATVRWRDGMRARTQLQSFGVPRPERPEGGKS
jgi:hypothetical protein